MVLDILCVLISMLAVITKKERFVDYTKKKVLNRYLGANTKEEEDKEKTTTIFSALSDVDAINKIFIEQTDLDDKIANLNKIK